MNHQSNTGIAVGVLIALLVVVAGAVAITGFWHPGFFLSGEKAEQQHVAMATGSGGSDVDQVKHVAEQAAMSVNTRDESLAVSVTCEAKGKPDFSELPPDMKAEVVGEPTMDGTTKAKISVRFTAHGRTEEESLRLAKRQGRWCID